MKDFGVTLHASCVVSSGHGVLIIGPSGSGKSALALNLMALGADLVSDDRTILEVRRGFLQASCPPAIRGMVEARGVGILAHPYVETSGVSLVIDMAQVEDARLPYRHTHTVLDITLPCLHKVEEPHFPAAIHAYLRGGNLQEIE